MPAYGLIRCHQHQAFGAALGGQQPIKWIAMVIGQSEEP